MSFWARRRRVFAAAAFALATTGMVAYMRKSGEDGSGTSREGNISANIRYPIQNNVPTIPHFPSSKQRASAPNF